MILSYLKNLNEKKFFKYYNKMYNYIKKYLRIQMLLI